MVSIVQAGTNNTDEQIDAIIKSCLNPESPTSFFLYAGAGSGKTYSLVKALEEFESSHGKEFRRAGKKIAVITYTNAACDEIIDRVKGNPLFHISTIHSFCWLQIKVFHDDIRAWLCNSIPQEISRLEQEEAKGRPGTQASITRQRSIENKKERLQWLTKRREFTYNPNGENIGKDSISHSEVIKICSDFLVNKSSFQQIVVNRYPFLLIDESQDTNKDLIEAFFAVEEHKKGEFGLGLIGDMMQRIYGDGKHDLGANPAAHWKTPIKQMNRRCPKRIVALANDIRSETDKQEQKFLEGKTDGFVRFFIAPANIDKINFEQSARDKMAEVTGDTLWHNADDVKHLMLEHKMAAVRMGFKDMFEALSTSKGFQTGLKSGDLPPVRFFSEYILPLYQLQKEKNYHGVMTHLRKTKSPLIDAHFLRFKSNSENPLMPIKDAIKQVIELIDSSEAVSFLDVLQCAAKNSIFLIPESLIPFSEASENIDSEEDTDTTTVDEEEKTSSHVAIDAFLRTSFKQIEPYKRYVSREAAFDTHQGVKGLEFERVLVVMDDEEAGGFLFSYEKMFEITPLTKSDLEKRSRGEEIGIDRTRRLFYVTCTRAEKSLALIAYTQDPALLKKKVIEKGWFIDAEVTQF